MKATKLPESFRSYFWDVDFNKLDSNEHSFLITKRVLDRGNTSAIVWLIDTYGTEKIKEVLQKPYSPIHFGLYS